MARTVFLPARGETVAKPADQAASHMDLAMNENREIRANMSEMNINEALTRAGEALMSGDVARGLKICELVFEREPENVDALHVAGLLRLRAGDAEGALELLIKAAGLAPDRADVTLSLGRALIRAGRAMEALSRFGAALEAMPRLPAPWIGLAEARMMLGDTEAAITTLEEAAGAVDKPDAIRRRLAPLYHQIERFDDAAALYQKLVETTPEDAGAWGNLGNALLESGRGRESVAPYRKMRELAPENPGARFNLGAALLWNEELDEAETELLAAAEMDPDFSWTYENLGAIALLRNDGPGALRFFERARVLRPGEGPDIGLEWRKCLARLPIVNASEEAIEANRAMYEAGLRRLLDIFDPANPRHVSTAMEGLRHLPFYLAYQGRVDRDLQRLFGGFLAAVARAAHPERSSSPAMPQPEPDGRFRIAFVSQYFHNHSVWKLPLRGWLEHLDRKRFRVLCCATTPTPVSAARELCDRFVECPSLELAVREIAADAPHAVIFPEIGMDWRSAHIAALRLAPLQLAGAGHPETTGLDSIDIFLSSELMEPADADAHYVERLVRLPNLSSCNYPPKPGKKVTRKELGLPEDETLVFSPQSLFKYLPRYDDVFARIAERAPGARFLFIRHDKSDKVTAAFRDRVARGFAERGLDSDRHVMFLPRLTPEGFTGLCGLCDIFLDNPGWSGNNTSLEAIWQGLPVVAFPVGPMRGRHAAANLRMTGMTETICEDVDAFVNLAAELVNEPDRRRELRERMLANRDGAFHDQSPVRALEALLIKEIRARL